MFGCRCAFKTHALRPVTYAPLRFALRTRGGLHVAVTPRSYALPFADFGLRWFTHAQLTVGYRLHVTQPPHPVDWPRYTTLPCPQLRDARSARALHVTLPGLPVLPQLRAGLRTRFPAAALIADWLVGCVWRTTRLRLLYVVSYAHLVIYVLHTHFTHAVI